MSVSKLLGTKSLQLPKRGYLARMRVYLSEMYPVPVRLLSSVLLYVSFVMFLSRIHGVEPSVLSLHTVVGIWSIFALMLILRLMDELKDKEIDRELFSHRPLPSGRVRESDIWFSIVAAIALYVGANALISNTFWMALIVLKYAMLMFKYFFIPQILRKHLLLNLATHNPIIPMMLIYVLFLFADVHHVAFKNLNWSSSILVVLMYWAVFFAWEVARKIRSKEEENAYVTYSQVLGRIGAVVVAVVPQTVAFTIALYFYQTLSLSTVFLVIAIVGYGMTMWGHLRFILRPNPVTSKLKDFAARYAVSVLVAGIFELALGD